MRRQELTRVEALAREAAVASGVELVDVEYNPARGRAVLRLYIDKPGGVTVDDCTRVSRAMGDAVDIEDPIPGRYRLEVSSPGVDKALKSVRDFERFSGRPARLVLRHPMQGRATVAGVIRGCKDETVTVETDLQGEVQVKLQDIARARLDVDPWEQARIKGKRRHAG